MKNFGRKQFGVGSQGSVKIISICYSAPVALSWKSKHFDQDGLLHNLQVSPQFQCEVNSSDEMCVQPHFYRTLLAESWNLEKLQSAHGTKQKAQQ